MNYFDRYVAIYCHPEFKEEFAEWQKACKGQDGESYEKAIRLGRELSAKWGENPSVIELTIKNFKEKGLKNNRWSPFSKEKVITEQDFDGTYKKLRVNMTKGIEELLEAFRRIYARYKKIIPVSKKANKKSKIDIWKVYLMHHEEGLNVSQIARKLNSKITKSSVDDSEYKKTYEAVKRAIKTAQKKIEVVKAVE